MNSSFESSLVGLVVSVLIRIILYFRVGNLDTDSKNFLYWSPYV